MKSGEWFEWVRNKVGVVRRRLAFNLRGIRRQDHFHLGFERPLFAPLVHEDDTWAITTVKGGLGCVTVINQSHTGAMVSLRTEFATHSTLSQQCWLEGIGAGRSRDNDNNIKFSLNGDGVRYLVCIERMDHDQHPRQTFKLVAHGEIVLIQDPDFNPPYHHFPDDDNIDANTLCDDY